MGAGVGAGRRRSGGRRLGLGFSGLGLGRSGLSGGRGFSGSLGLSLGGSSGSLSGLGLSGLGGGHGLRDRLGLLGDGFGLSLGVAPLQAPLRWARAQRPRRRPRTQRPARIPRPLFRDSAAVGLGLSGGDSGLRLDLGHVRAPRPRGPRAGTDSDVSTSGVRGLGVGWSSVTGIRPSAGTSTLRMLIGARGEVWSLGLIPAAAILSTMSIPGHRAEDGVAVAVAALRQRRVLVDDEELVAVAVRVAGLAGQGHGPSRVDVVRRDVLDAEVVARGRRLTGTRRVTALEHPDALRVSGEAVAGAVVVVVLLRQERERRHRLRGRGAVEVHGDVAAGGLHRRDEGLALCRREVRLAGDRLGAGHGRGSWCSRRGSWG